MVYLFYVIKEKTQKTLLFYKFEETFKGQSFRIHSIYSASRSKIEDKGKDEPADPDSQESWSNNCFQENLVKSVSRQFCQADVALGLVHLGSCLVKKQALPLKVFERKSPY